MANYIYAIWFGAKTVELLSLGQIGSDLAFTVCQTIYFWYILLLFFSYRRIPSAQCTTLPIGSKSCSTLQIPAKICDY